MSHLTPPTAHPVTTRLGSLAVATIGSGPPAVLWHSLFVDSTTWTRLTPQLDGERRLVLIDGPNHGANTPRRRPFTLEDCVGAAVDVLDQLDITGPVDWLGNAWGGHVGVLFAAAHPQRCRTLTAIGAPIHAYSDADRRRTRLLSLLYLALGPRSVSRPLVDALLGPDARAEDPTGAAIVADAFARAERRGMYDAIRWLSLHRPDLTDVLDRLQTPTLLTTGPNDPMWTTTAARAAAGHLRTGALVILPGAGHVGPLLQAAPQVADLVTAFWRDPAGTVTAHKLAHPNANPG
ncbi:MAG: alpha/beta fold hydrolase [Micrococcales bacterium]|nr:alpha/beta fold hydrolase [Micrococcales bacterium]